MATYHVTTFGCQMNEHDSERMRGMLDSLGYEEAGSRSEADLILFNTCSIRESADNRFIAHLGEAKRLKSEDPERTVGVGGCWAQSVKDEVFERFPFVDVAFGPGQIHGLAEFLTQDSLTAQGYFELEELSGHLPAKRAREFQAWVQISQGCNCVCAYCIVPQTRGREVSRAHAELRALCPHIHLPLQSGSTRILKAMRRTYNRDRYLDRVAQIREHVPDCALTTDIIVGFPGETEEDFARTLEVVDRVGYDGAFTFIFSPRRGTEAATMPDQVPHPVKRERMERLVELVQRRARERAERFIGRTVAVLVEGPSRTDPARLRGRIGHNKTVNFDGIAEPGEMVEVEIT